MPKIPKRSNFGLLWHRRNPAYIDKNPQVWYHFKVNPAGALARKTVFSELFRLTAYRKVRA